MLIRVKDFDPHEILKFIRQSTGKTQKEFAQDIGKSVDWVKSNEIGRSDYKFKDLKKLADKNDIDIYILNKEENPIIYKVKKHSKSKEKESIPN